MNQFIVHFPVWLIPHREIQPRLFVYNAFVVGERLETVFSMVRAHTAFAKTAESHFACSQMDDGVVDTASAKSTCFHNFLGCSFV